MAEAAIAPETRELYLDLLKQCLTDVIYADHPLANAIPASPFGRPVWQRPLVWLTGLMAQAMGSQLVEQNRSPFVGPERLDGDAIRERRAVGADWPPRAHTMIGRKRLDNLHATIRTVIEERVPGDLIETGVWRGGAAILMRAALAAYGDTERHVWVADSFRGLPPPDEARFPADTGSRLHAVPALAVSRDEVERNFRAYGLLDGRVRFLEGWFADTLPSAPIKQLAVLRMDGDLYASTMQVLEALYDRLSPGGFAIVDDYSLPQCRAAVDDFRRERGSDEPVERIDWTGVFWRKRQSQATSVSVAGRV